MASSHPAAAQLPSQYNNKTPRKDKVTAASTSEPPETSASHLLRDTNNDTLQRIPGSGISFPETNQLSEIEYKSFLDEAAKRDHRKIGEGQELLLFSGLCPGGCFFLHHGARIYNALIELLRGEYVKRGYQEVITPNMYNSKLWETSGHWQNSKDDMFTFDVVEDQSLLRKNYVRVASTSV